MMDLIRSCRRLLSLIALSESGSIEKIIRYLLICWVASWMELISISAAIPVIISINSEVWMAQINSIAAQLIPSYYFPILDIHVCLIFMVLLLTALALRMYISYYSIYLMYEITTNVTEILIRKVIRFPVVYFQEKNLPEVYAQINEKSAHLISSLLLPIIQIINFMFSLTAALVIFYYSGSSESFAGLPVVILIYLIMYFAINKRVKALSKQGNILTGQVSTRLFDGLRAIKELKVYNSEKWAIDSYMIPFGNLFKKVHALVQFYSSIPRIILDFVFISALIIFVLYRKYAGYGFEETVVLVGVLGLVTVRLAPMAQTAFAAIMSYRGNYYFIDEIFEVLDKNYPEYTADKIMLSDKNYFVMFDNVSFGFENCERIFSNLNLVIKQDSWTLIRGKSGAGKSTILNLILGFYMPVSGNISIARELREKKSGIGYVGQNVYIANCSLAENICFEHEVETRKMLASKIIKITEMVGLGSLVERWPQGIEEVVSEEGRGLSGGQRQRVGLARALFSNCDVLVLDEFGSGLDRSSLYELLKMLKESGQVRTVIMVSHIESLTDWFDSILEVSDGNVTMNTCR